MKPRTTLSSIWALFSLLCINGLFAVPDLVIQDIWSSPDPLVLGQPYTFYARVLNQGDTTASAGFLASQRVDFSLDGNIIGSAFYDDVAPGSNVVVSITDTALASPFSSHQFRAVADADNRIDEGGMEGNNSRTENWNITSPDLVVLDIWTVPANPISGESVTVYASVRNQGNAATADPFSSFSVAFFLDGAYIGQGIYFLGLPPNTTATCSISIASPAPGLHTLRVCADQNHQVWESDESNNCRSESSTVLPGPILQVSSNVLTFAYARAEQSFAIWNSGGGVLGYSVDANRSWLGVFPGGGTCAAGQTNQVAVSIDVSGLLIGTHTGTITVATTVGNSHLPVTVNILDDDGDQIPDGWETQHFGSAANCNPNLDTDGDGQSNRQEWIGGSNPTNKLSAFAITGAELSPGGSNIVIHWPTLPGRVYDVLWSANANGPFLPLGSNLPHSQTNYSDTIAPPSGFYRVNVRLQ